MVSYGHKRERATCVANENTLDQGNVHPAAWNMGKILSKNKLRIKTNSLMLDCTRGKLIRDSSLCDCSVCCLLLIYDKNLPGFEGIRNSSKISPCFSHVSMNMATKVSVLFASKCCQYTFWLGED